MVFIFLIESDLNILRPKIHFAEKKDLFIVVQAETPLRPLSISTQAPLTKPDAGTARALEECSGRHQVPANAAMDSTFSVKFVVEIGCNHQA